MKKIENAFQVTEHTDAMLAYWDKDLVCRFANASYIKWFGMSPSDMIDKITLPVLLGPLYELNLPYINNALEGKTQVFERDILTPDGQVKNAIATYKPEMKNGVVLGFYAHVADISHVKNSTVKEIETKEDYANLLVRQNYLNGVEYVLRSSIYTKFAGIEVLARQFFVSPTRLKKDFKLRYGSTIFSYYRNLQMQVADKYIRNHVYSKKQLAEMFGFDNSSNFSNCYKRFRAPEVVTTNVCTPSVADHIESDRTRLSIDYENMLVCLEHLHIGIWQRDFGSNKTIWNKIVLDILELPPGFEPDMNPALHFLKDESQREMVKTLLNDAFVAGKVFDFQAVILTARGNEKTIRVTGFPQFENDICKRMHGTFQVV